MVIVTTFFQMLTLLIMIGGGYVVTKMGMLDEHTNKQMSKMIVNFFSPLLVISCAAESVGSISLKTMGTVMLIAVGMFAVFIAAGMILSPFFDKRTEQRKIYQMMFVFSNLGFIGIPVVSSILGSEYVVYVTEFMMVNTIVLYTYGIALLEERFSVKSLKEMINPGTIAGIAAVLIIVSGTRLPDFIKTAVAYLGNVTSPMALVSVGFSLVQADLRKIFVQRRLYVFAVVKLLLIPLIMLPVLKMVTGDAALISVCMIMFGMPVGNMPLLLGTQKGIDGTTCSAAIILTTILCVFTVPILITFS